MKLQKMAGAFSGIVLLFGMGGCAVRSENGQLNFSVGNAAAINGSGKVVDENRPVSALHGVALESLGSLRIVQGDTESLTVTADDNLLPHITSQVAGGVLTLGTTGTIGRVTKLEYLLTVKNLDMITLAGMGSVTVDELKGGKLRLELSGMGSLSAAPLTLDGALETAISGMGSMKLGGVQASSTQVELSGMGSVDFGRLETKVARLDCSGAGGVHIGELQGQTLEAALSGMGNVEIGRGAIETQTVSVDSMGSYHAGNLESKTARVESNGMGSASVRASAQIDATASSSGSIDYAGNPPVVRAEKSGMGSINRR